MIHTITLIFNAKRLQNKTFQRLSFPNPTPTAARDTATPIPQIANPDSVAYSSKPEPNRTYRLPPQWKSRNPNTPRLTADDLITSPPLLANMFQFTQAVRKKEKG